MTKPIVATVTGPVFDCVMDSLIELYSGTTLLGENDDFYDAETGSCGELQDVRGPYCCSKIDPTDPSPPDDQSFAMDLPAGTYTLTVSGYESAIGAYVLDVAILH